MIDSAKTTAEEFAADVRSKARAALEKGQAVASDARALAQGNVEACLESGKILANGLKDIGTRQAAEGQATFAALTSEVKELFAAKSPAELFKLQSEMARRNIEAVFTLGTKNGEALLELAKDAAAPITKQANAVVETLRKVG